MKLRSASSAESGGEGGIRFAGTIGTWASPALSPTCAHAAAARQRAAKEKVRRGADQGAVAMEDEGAGQDDVIQEHRALIHAAVAVGVLEHDHRALRLVFRRPVVVLHVARHLDHPKTAVGRELQYRRVADQRGLGHELDAVARGDLEAAERFFGRERG